MTWCQVIGGQGRAGWGAGEGERRASGVPRLHRKHHHRLLLRCPRPPPASPPPSASRGPPAHLGVGAGVEGGQEEAVDDVERVQRTVLERLKPGARQVAGAVVRRKLACGTRSGGTRGAASEENA